MLSYQCHYQCQAVTYQSFQCQFFSKTMQGITWCSFVRCVRMLFGHSLYRDLSQGQLFHFYHKFPPTFVSPFFSRSPSIVEASSLNGLAILSNGQLQHVDRSESKQRAEAIVRCKRVKQKSIMVRNDTLRGLFSALNSVFTYINGLFRCYRRNWRPGTNTFKVQATRTNTHIRSDWLPD